MNCSTTAALRAHWRRLFDQCSAARLRNWCSARLLARQIHENGVTYNVYADPKAPIALELDLLPHVIAADEWEQLSAGIAQRARLLNAVLADLYGPQRLIAEGLLPAELVFGHNNFLWPCQGINPPEGAFLHLYAVDLARTPDGRWWVTADRTQAPSGAGYALENRTIVSRAFPELYRDLKVQHLAGFFRTLQETLARQAPSDEEVPLVVLLTPGRFNESYFEHLYLARQLGYPLVEGGDLTVRDATVYLKPSVACAGSTRSCAGSTTTSAIRWSCVPIRPGRAGLARGRAPGRCWWPTPSAAAYSNRRDWWGSCRRSISSCLVKS
jgi:uncharacterized circularly permuted ATP-grasp superfamily protein